MYEEKEAVLSFIAWSKSYFIVSDHMRFRIEAFMVAAAHQRRGIGKQLLTHLESLAQKEKRAIVELVTSHTRQKNGTHLFYQSMGYQDEATTAKCSFRKEFSRA